MNTKSVFLVLMVFISTTGLLQASSATGKEALCEKTASSLAREGKLDEGIDQIRQCIEKGSSRAKSHVVLGYLLLEKGEPQQAMASFEKALQLRPRSSDAKTGKGILLAQQGDLKGAEATLLDALKLNPDPARTYYELGILYQQLGDTQQAVDFFKQGIASYEEEKGK